MGDKFWRGKDFDVKPKANLENRKIDIPGFGLTGYDESSVSDSNESTRKNKEAARIYKKAEELVESHRKQGGGEIDLANAIKVVMEKEVVIKCPNCDEDLRIDSGKGKKVRVPCTHCGHIFTTGTWTVVSAPALI